MRSISADFTIVAAVTIAMLLFSWVGFTASDDWAYSQGAQGWLSQGFFVGENHWHLRAPHVLATAASYGLFGFGEFQLILPTILFFVILLLNTYYFVDKFAGRDAALISCILLALSPLMASSATQTSADITESLFIFLSVFLFLRAADSAAPSHMLFYAGIAAGLGWLTRETSAGLVVTYGLLFLAGYRYPRRDYWIMAAGAAAVVAVEMIYMAVMTGNPLYRYVIDFSLQAESIQKLAPGGVTLPGVGEAVSSVGGNVSAHWLVDPILALLLNQEFGLTFWAAAPIALWLCYSKRVSPGHRNFARILSLLAIVWFLVIAYVMGLRELPRYFMTPAIAALIMIAVWAAHYRSTIPRMAFILLAGGFAAAGLAGVYVSNNNFLYSERGAAQLIAGHGQIIYTDMRTAERARSLLKLKHLPELISADPPPPGAIYLYSPSNVAQGQVYGRTFDSGQYRPKPDWPQIWSDDPGRKYAGIALEKLGLKQFIPQGVYAKLNYPNLPLTAYRVPDGEKDETGKN